MQGMQRLDRHHAHDQNTVILLMPNIHVQQQQHVALAILNKIKN